MASHIARLSTIVALLIFPTACQQKSADPEAKRSQLLPDEADLLLQSREFKKCADNASLALSKLEPLIADSPEDSDLRILKSRALFDLFLAKNSVVIENAKVRPRSLVRLPEFNEYIDYEETAGAALKELAFLINRSDKLSYEQQGFVQSVVAAIFRLSLKTTKESEVAYRKAIESYQKWSAELQSEKQKVDKNRGLITKIAQYIKDLRMAQSEVSLLGEDWKGALTLLEEQAGGKDLRYFSASFDRLEQRLDEIDDKLRDEKNSKPATVNRLMTALSAHKKDPTALEQVAGMGAYEANLIRVRNERTELQNNLIYRVICYRELGQQENVAQAMQIFRQYYPELHSQLNSSLKSK